MCFVFFFLSKIIDVTVKMYEYEAEKLVDIIPQLTVFCNCTKHIKEGDCLVQM